MPAPQPQSSKREQALSALFRCLQSLAGPDGLKVERNEPLPQKLARGGLVILHDGDPGDPEVCLSPLSYAWEHKAELDVLVPGATAADRDAALDALLARLAHALADDTTLGGWSTTAAWSRRRGSPPCPSRVARPGKAPRSR